MATPSNATVHLYRDREGLWRARVEWTDAETGEQRVEPWGPSPGVMCPSEAAQWVAESWEMEVGV